MKRIYSNYSDDEFEQISKCAQTAGMTVSAFCKYIVLEKVGGTVENFPQDIIKRTASKTTGYETRKMFYCIRAVP